MKILLRKAVTEEAKGLSRVLWRKSNLSMKQASRRAKKPLFADGMLAEGFPQHGPSPTH